MDGLINAGSIISPDEVLIELQRKDDDVHAWAKGRPVLFRPLDEELQRASAQILRRHKKLVDTRSNRNRADPFVIGLASITPGAVVVTDKITPGTPGRPTIPYVCRVENIRFIGIARMIEEVGWVF